jgi:hypothetical protein
MPSLRLLSIRVSVFDLEGSNVEDLFGGVKRDLQKGPTPSPGFRQGIGWACRLVPG